VLEVTPTIEDCCVAESKHRNVCQEAAGRVLHVSSSAVEGKDQIFAFEGSFHQNG